MNELPDFNNVYGQLYGLDGLAIVRDVATAVSGIEKVSIYVSGFDGAETLTIAGERIDFESQSLGASQHLLNGGVAGTVDEVIRFVRSLSRALTDAGVEHSFEVYNEEQDLVKEIPKAN